MDLEETMKEVIIEAEDKHAELGSVEHKMQWAKMFHCTHVPLDSQQRK